MEIKMAMICSPVLELKDHGPPLFSKHQGKAVFTFVCTKLCKLLWCTPTPILAGPLDWEKSPPLLDFRCRAPSWRTVAHCAAVCGFVANWADSPFSGPLTIASFPTLMLEISGGLGTSVLSLTQVDPEITLSHLGFCPTLPPEHFPGRDISH